MFPEKTTFSHDAHFDVKGDARRTTLALLRPPYQYISQD